MAQTYDAIATTTLGSSSSSITFSSIPATYTDLEIVFNGTITGSGDTGIRFNGNTSGSYQAVYLRGNGSTYSSIRDSNLTYGGIAIAAPSGKPQFIKVSVFDYLTSSAYKTYFASSFEDNVSSGWVGKITGSWYENAAVTSITIMSSNTFNSGLTATLYGIKNA